jgi:hypothetical protein
MVKRRPRVWLVATMACCVVGIAAVARAQVSVAVTSTVAITVAQGASISNAGAFSVTNSSNASITISAINLSATNAGIFSSMTLTGQVPGSAAVSAPSSPNPPGGSNTFNFPNLPALLNGQTATFQLSAIATSGPVPTPTSDSVHRKRLEVLYAGMMWPLALGHSRTANILLSLVAMGMLLMAGKLRRRHLVLLAMALILAATEVGCGNTNSGVTGTSTQVVQTITASSGGSATGLPASLGSITVQ